MENIWICQICHQHCRSERAMILHECSPYHNMGEQIPPLSIAPDPTHTESWWSVFRRLSRQCRYCVRFWRSGDSLKLSWWLARKVVI